MLRKSLITVLFSLLALAAPAVAQAAQARSGAVVFSKTTTVGGETKGGLFAARDGHLNQLTEDPADTEPAFSPDGRTIAFARDDDIYSVRPDGSAQRHLTSGGEIDSAPRIAPNGRYLVFARRASAAGAASLYTVRVTGGRLHRLSAGGDDREANFAPDGGLIAFVRSRGSFEGGNDDIYSVRPDGAGLARLTRTGGVDEFAPRYFAGGIVFSRGESTPGAAAYADIYTMRRNGTRVRSQVAGVGSAYVEDVSPGGHLLVFRRDQGLWAKRIGRGRARKLTELPDGSRTTSVLSSDGRRVAAFVAVEDRQSLLAIDVAGGRSTDLASGYDFSSPAGGTELGPEIDWQPVPRPHHR